MAPCEAAGADEVWAGTTDVIRLDPADLPARAGVSRFVAVLAVSFARRPRASPCPAATCEPQRKGTLRPDSDLGAAYRKHIYPYNDVSVLIVSREEGDVDGRLARPAADGELC